MEKTANKQKMHGGKIALYVIAILWTVVTLFPVVVTVMASFKTNSEIYLNLLSFPKKIMFQNYISANKTADALNTIKNSLVVATLTTVFNTVVGMMAAIHLIKKRLQIPEMGICILHDWSNGSGSLYTDPDQQHCNSIKCKEQPVLPDPDLCCVWYVPGDIPLYRIHGWNLQEPG